MEETIRGCQHFLSIKDKDDLLRHTLISGIISSYTRSFVECKGHSSIKKTYGDFGDPNMKIVHDKTCNARRYIYGHVDAIDGASIFDVSETQKEINRVLVKLTKGGSVTSGIKRSSVPDDYIKLVMDLADFQRNRMHVAIEEKLTHFLKSKNMAPGQYKLRPDENEERESGGGGKV